MTYLPKSIFCKYFLVKLLHSWYKMDKHILEGICWHLLHEDCHLSNTCSEMHNGDHLRIR